MNSGMGSMPVGDVIPEIVLLVGTVVVLLFALSAPRRVQWWSSVIAIVTIGATSAVTVKLMSAGSIPQRLTFFDTYAIDGAALWAKQIILAASAIVVVLSVDWFRSDQRHGEYYAIVLMSALGAIMMAGAADLMELTLAVLLSSATSSVLIAYHRQSRRAGEAAIKYYLLGALSNGLMVYGIVLLFGLAATTTYAGLATALRTAHSLPLIAGVALTIVGLAFKIGAVPVHAWMPDVSEGAPAPVSAFVTTLPKIGALIALARLMAIMPEATSGWRPVVALLAALTMTIGNVAALWQENIRRLLGWSAVSQTGYGMMAVVALNRSDLAAPSLLYFLVAYTLGNLAAFGVVIQLRGEARITHYHGLAQKHPVLAGAVVVSFLSFVGIPPLAGFAAKVALFGASIDAGYAWLAILAIVNTVISLAYYARIIGHMYFSDPSGEDSSGSLAIMGWAPNACVLICSLAIVAVGIAAEPLFASFRAALLLP